MLMKEIFKNWRGSIQKGWSAFDGWKQNWYYAKRDIEDATANYLGDTSKVFALELVELLADMALQFRPKVAALIKKASNFEELEKIENQIIDMNLDHMREIVYSNPQLDLSLVEEQYLDAYHIINSLRGEIEKREDELEEADPEAFKAYLGRDA